MKCHFTLDVTSGDQLKVKQRIIIHTQQTSSQQNKGDDEKVVVLAVHHITIKELDDEETFKDEVLKAFLELKDVG